MGINTSSSNLPYSVHKQIYIYTYDFSCMMHVSCVIIK